MTRPLVYIAGPYRSESVSGIRRNIALAADAADALIRAGFDVCLPHALGNTLDVFGTRYGDAWWLASTLRMMKRCDIVYRLPGASEGADAEVAEAVRCGMPVYHSLDELTGGEVA